MKSAVMRPRLRPVYRVLIFAVVSAFCAGQIVRGVRYLWASEVEMFHLLRSNSASEAKVSQSSGGLTSIDSYGNYVCP